MRAPARPGPVLAARASRGRHASWPRAVQGGRKPPCADPHALSQIIEWYALETGAPLVRQPVGDRSSSAYLAIHPFGKLPAGKAADGTPIFESGALLLYIADAFGGANTPEKRVEGSKWVLWANSSYWPAVEGQRKAPAAMCAGLEKILAVQPYLLGAEFSVADAAVGAYLYYTAAFFREKFSGYPAIQKYLEAIRGRKHFKSTIGAE